MDEKKKQVLIELLTTLLVLLFYYLSTMPEWKLQMYGRMVRQKLDKLRESGPVQSLEHREILRKFRQEISEWEHRNASEG